MTNCTFTSVFMTFTLSAVGCSLIQENAYAASASPLESARPSRPGPPRYVENYSFLSDPAKRTDIFDPIRFVQLGDSSRFQFGGALRYKYESVDNPAFGLRGVEHDEYLQQRIQVYGSLHLFDDKLRAFVELQDTSSMGKEMFSPYDESDTEIHQAFIDAKLVSGADGTLSARLGRQEMAYGEQVLVTVREVHNVRHTFDGLRLSFSSRNGYKLDAFAVRPVTNIRPGSFNDSSTDSGEFYGIYATAPAGKKFGIDIYGMGYLRDNRILNGSAGEEERYTVGTRLFKKGAGFNYTADFMYQFGEHEHADIRAWGVSSFTGYAFNGAPWQPNFGLRIDAASGDENRNDGESNTFDPLFPANGKLYGNGSLITLSNVAMAGPEFTLSPRNNFMLSSNVLMLWRESEDDAAYMPGLAQVPGTANIDGKRLGTSYRAFARWMPTTNFTMDLEYQYYDVAGVLKDAGAENVSYASVRGYFMF